jgi:hypothetical protein
MEDNNKKPVEKTKNETEPKELKLEVRRVRTNVRAGMFGGHSRSAV